MRCPIETQENAELLLAYCARRLHPETTLMLERHMESCPACRAFQEGQQAVWAALDAWEAEPIAADFDRRLYRRIEQEDQASWWQRLARPLAPLLVRQGLPAAAAACVLLVAGLLLERPGRLPDSATPPAQVEAVQAEQVERALDDLEMIREFNVAVRSEAVRQDPM